MGTPKIEEAEFYCAKDGARVFGLTRTQVYNAMSEGALPYRQYGRRRLIARADLMALVGQLPVKRGRGADASA